MKPEDRSGERHTKGPLVALVIPLVAVLAPAMGGATQIWSQAAILFLTGLLFVLAPPERALGRVMNGIVLLAFILALSAFLPASWFHAMEWRKVLESQFALALPATRSPQPWLTFEATWLLFAGIGWAYYLLAYPWERPTRRRALRTFAKGILLLVALALGASFAGYRIPFWPPVLNLPSGFGFFPNRNQTAGLLALSGIVVVAAGYQGLRRRRLASIGWLIGLALILTALVLAYSRAGIALFFGGTALWIFVSSAASRSPRAIVFSLVALVLLLWAGTRFGSETFRRFESTGTPAATDFRFLLQRDAFSLSLEQPWLGVGLGNFEPMFRFHRDQSRKENRAIHPESDWLWLAIEMGWLLPVSFLLALTLWLRGSFRPFREWGSTIELAALIYGLGFFVHGLIDVSGHRMGTLWPALFVMSTTVRLRPAADATPWIRPAFGVVGFLLIIVSGCWFCSIAGGPSFPTSAAFNRFRAKAKVAATQGAVTEMIENVNAALHIAPLDWTLYYERAGAEATAGLTSDAIRDFQVSRYLQGSLAGPCIEEGKIWAALNEPEYALEAWTEAVRRSADKRLVYREIMSAAAALPEIVASMDGWAQLDIERLLAFLEVASPEVFLTETDRLVESDPDLAALSPDQLAIFFQIWERKGDRETLAQALLTHPDWQKQAWRFLAEYHAARKDFQVAFETVRHFASPPPLPKVELRIPRSELETRFLLDPDNLTNGLSLFTAQVQVESFEDALRTLHKIQQTLHPPSYLWFMEAETHAQREDWESAWKAWSDFASRIPR